MRPNKLILQPKLSIIDCFLKYQLGYLDARPRERPLLVPVAGCGPAAAAHDPRGEGRAREREELDRFAVLVLFGEVEWGLEYRRRGRGGGVSG